MSSSGSDDFQMSLLTDEEIAQIPEINELPSGEVCAICLGDFQGNNAARQLPCNHSFHEECLVPWLQTKSTCPTCRHQLVDNHQLEELLNEIYDGNLDDNDDDVFIIDSDHEDEVFDVDDNSDSDVEIIEEIEDDSD